MKSLVIIDDQQELSFFMSPYIMDALRIFLHFLILKWAWKKGIALNHVYRIELWATKYKYNFEQICNKFLLASSFSFILETNSLYVIMPRKSISNIGDWYVSPWVVYFRIYGYIKSPFLLPHYVPNKLVLLEIYYHTYVMSFGPTIIRNKKNPWPKLSLQVGSYRIKNTKQEEAEIQIFNVYQFRDMPFYKHDLEYFLNNFCS